MRHATWSIKIERLQTHLAVGVYDDERDPQPVWVSVTMCGLAPAVPTGLDECLDYEPLCRWLASEWPRSPHTPLMETRLNEVFDFIFALDARVREATVGLYKQRVSRYAAAIGVERSTSRDEHAKAMLPRLQPARARNGSGAGNTQRHEQTMNL